ncbi:uncharacterized protein LOC122363486 [Amphibalanus amphitrite]|uniref:uncharacterized protein LOC122363486 n=1 Tax=Amphibalanus amphitrite TaxID=1232801 RepID=UPI001C91FC23|nr:uncharacterized protein LOC122363486 [Amphibalanus amphitrite]
MTRQVILLAAVSAFVSATAASLRLKPARSELSPSPQPRFGSGLVHENSSENDRRLHVQSYDKVNPEKPELIPLPSSLPHSASDHNFEEAIILHHYEHQRREYQHHEPENNEHRASMWNSFDPRGHGLAHDDQLQRGGREKRTLHKIWRGLDKFGRGIKNMLLPTRRPGPLPGLAADQPAPDPGPWSPSVPGYGTAGGPGYWVPAGDGPTGHWIPAGLEPPAAQPTAPVWTDWYGSRDRDTTPHPQWWTSATWTASPTAAWTTTSSPAPTTTTPSPESATTATPAPTSTAAAAATTAGSRSGGGILVLVTQPQISDGRPACRRGFTYHAESQMCHEPCPSGASFRAHLAACYCDRGDYAVNFFLWRCAPAGGGT